LRINYAYTIGGVSGLSGGNYPTTLKITPSTNSANDDNVGIGLEYSALPKTKLHVNGDVYTQEFFYFLIITFSHIDNLAKNNKIVQ